MDSGRPVDPADLPPALKWEDAVWKFYERVRTQWRHGFGGRSGLDYGPVVQLAQARGWDIDLTLELIRVIEVETLNWDADESKQSAG
jgi:sugar phosphate isomerase/epimerase